MKQIIFVILTFLIVYFGIINLTLPYVLIFCYTLFGILLFLWIFIPLFQKTRFKILFSHIKFENYKLIILFLVLTFLNFKALNDISIINVVYGLNLFFSILKITFAILMSFILFILLFNKQDEV